MKKLICALLCLFMATALFGCSKAAPAKEINLRDKLTSLAATDESLGLKGKYNAFDEIDGSVDSDLAGTWKNADGSVTYTFNDDGTYATESEGYGSSQARFTCIAAGDKKVICEESSMQSTDTDGNITESTVITSFVYEVDGSALYMVSVEDTTDENITSSYSSAVVMYKADESGSIDASIASNKVSLDSFAGTWEGDKGTVTIKDGTLTFGEDVYNVSVNEKNQLAVEKDGKVSVYPASIALIKEYDSEDRSVFTESYTLGINYTGSDENDRPNLAAALDDWHAEYEYETFYFSGSFTLQ